MPEPPTVDDLLAALSAVPQSQECGLTVDEMAERTGHSARWVQERLRGLFRHNKIRHCPVYRPCMNGRVMPHSTYKLIEG